MAFPVLMLLASSLCCMPGTAKATPTGQSAQEPMTLYDLTYTARWAEDAARIPEPWDEIHAVTTLQGIVNRAAPCLYLRAISNPEGGNIPLDDWHCGAESAGA